jgi:hypothetical protein
MSLTDRSKPILIAAALLAIDAAAKLLPEERG